MVVTDLKRVIAYSTMSQIGYMIMAVSSAAYTAGLFHLMTHAFFKALLFMAAGSVIAAMAGNQNLDEMGGFRKAMPFTFGCMLIGGLALSGFPPFVGLLLQGRDPRLRRGARRLARRAGRARLRRLVPDRDLHVPDDLPDVLGRPGRAGARPADDGHLYHAPEPTNPATGEVEDTDVGFPGPDHHIAEHEGSMKVAMGALAVLAIVGGVLQIPEVTDVLHHFLEPTFADSRYYNTLEPSDALTAFGLITGAVLSVSGIALAYHLWVRKPEAPASLRARLAPLHHFFVNKWYFDEIIDTLDRAAVRVVRALRAQHVRARRDLGAVRRRHHRRGAGRLGRRARGPVGLPALLRGAAAARADGARPLLPAGGELRRVNLSILLFWPLALAFLSRDDRPPRRAAGSRSSAR